MKCFSLANFAISHGLIIFGKLKASVFQYPEGLFEEQDELERALTLKSPEKPPPTEPKVEKPSPTTPSGTPTPVPSSEGSFGGPDQVGCYGQIVCQLGRRGDV